MNQAERDALAKRLVDTDQSINILGESLARTLVQLNNVVARLELLEQWYAKCHTDKLLKGTEAIDNFRSPYR